MSGKRATAFTESQLIDKLCDAVIARLAELASGPLPSKQWVVSSSLTRDARLQRIATTGVHLEMVNPVTRRAQ